MEKNTEKNTAQKKPFSSKLGTFVGNLFVTCIAVCLSAIAIALTLRFITFLF